MTDDDKRIPDPNTNAVNALNQISLAIAQLAKVTNAVFPQIVGTSLSATSGAITPTNFVGYASLVLPSTGQTIKVPYYT